MKKILCLILFVFTIQLAAQPNLAELEKLFDGRAGAFVLYDNSGEKYFRIFDERCAERKLPASTFKIPNSIIGLETGVIEDENFVIEWDGVEREVKEWNKNNTLADAIKYSVVPYYQELARRVGVEKMQKYLNDFDYGNKKIGEKVDAFWLDNSLKISPDEQITFLKKFYFHELPASKISVDIVKKIMTTEVYPESVLKYKTGGGQNEDGAWLGWLVGFVEKKKPEVQDRKDIFFFALNVEGGSFAEVSKMRMKIVKEILKQFDLIQ